MTVCFVGGDLGFHCGTGGRIRWLREHHGPALVQQRDCVDIIAQEPLPEFQTAVVRGGAGRAGGVSGEVEGRGKPDGSNCVKIIINIEKKKVFILL